MTPELGQEIRRALAETPPRIDGFRVPRQLFFLGFPIRYSGCQNDRPIRLFRRDVCRYADCRVHESIALPRQRSAALKNSLLHFSFRSYDTWITKQAAYTKWSSEDKWDRGRRAGYFGLLLQPFFRFFQLYFLRRGFLDGLPGLQLCMLTAFFNSFIKQGRLWEMERALPQPDPEKSIGVNRPTLRLYVEPAVEDRPKPHGGNQPTPDIAVLVSSYQRPEHLRRALLSIACQRNVDGRFEVVVTDDGSDDETLGVVADFASQVDFPVHFTTHAHEAFQLARCRNEGVLVSSAPYLLFVDGDCVLPPDHLAFHLRRRRRGVVVAGDCCRLDEQTSNRIDDLAIREMTYLDLIPQCERSRLARQHRKAALYRLLCHPRKPKLVGNNIGVWREDIERINGLDEDFEGWGCEDDDLARRLRRTGVRIVSILNWTWTYHLWHPADDTCPAAWRDGTNVEKLLEDDRPTFCRKGLVHLDTRLRGDETDLRPTDVDLCESTRSRAGNGHGAAPR